MSIPTFHALIAAAGKPRRRDSFQVSDPLGSLSVIRRIIHTFRQAGAGDIVVVTGYQARELERHLARSGAICLRNEDWENSDMMASVRIGLAYLAASNCPVLFTPADIPLFTVSTVLLLLESGAESAVPQINKKRGHPLLRFFLDTRGTAVCVKPSASLRISALWWKFPTKASCLMQSFPLTVPSFWNATENNPFFRW